MSYLAQAQLQADPDFGRRVASVNVQQADFFRSQPEPAAALAAAVMRDDIGAGLVLLRLAAGAPTMADKVDNGDGTVDQSKITDAELLAITQANWPVVAALYFDADGHPLTPLIDKIR